MFDKIVELLTVGGVVALGVERFMEMVKAPFNKIADLAWRKAALIGVALVAGYGVSALLGFDGLALLGLEGSKWGGYAVTAVVGSVGSSGLHALLGWLVNLKDRALR